LELLRHSNLSAEYTRARVDCDNLTQVSALISFSSRDQALHLDHQADLLFQVSDQQSTKHFLLDCGSGKSPAMANVEYVGPGAI
jgi:hypothetical protein